MRGSEPFGETAPSEGRLLTAAVGGGHPGGPFLGAQERLDAQECLGAPRRSFWAGAPRSVSSRLRGTLSGHPENCLPRPAGAVRTPRWG